MILAVCLDRRVIYDVKLIRFARLAGHVGTAAWWLVTCRVAGGEGGGGRVTQTLSISRPSALPAAPRQWKPLHDQR